MWKGKETDHVAGGATTEFASPLFTRIYIVFSGSAVRQNSMRYGSFSEGNGTLVVTALDP